MERQSRKATLSSNYLLISSRRKSTNIYTPSMPSSLRKGWSTIMLEHRMELKYDGSTSSKASHIPVVSWLVAA
jgi:hypothetical protein